MTMIEITNIDNIFYGKRGVITASIGEDHCRVRLEVPVWFDPPKSGILGASLLTDVVLRRTDFEETGDTKP